MAFKWGLLTILKWDDPPGTLRTTLNPQEEFTCLQSCTSQVETGSAGYGTCRICLETRNSQVFFRNIHIRSMVYLPTCSIIFHTNQLNVGRHTISGSFGIAKEKGIAFKDIQRCCFSICSAVELSRMLMGSWIVGTHPCFLHRQSFGSLHIG